jgi:hypothetical protein
MPGDADRESRLRVDELADLIRATLVPVQHRDVEGFDPSRDAD